VPLAEINTAGVIIAVRTATDAVNASITGTSIVAIDDDPSHLPGGDGTPAHCKIMVFSARLWTMADNAYHFVDRWRVEGDVTEVADILEDALSLPRWWGSVYFDVKEIEPGEPHGIGKMIGLHAGGWLPYTLRINFRTVAANYPHGFTMEATGDLEGEGIWTFAQDGPFVDITYDWTIKANKPIIEKLSFLLKPIFRSNHNWTMRRGEESLRLELLRRRAKSESQQRAVPPPARPSFAVRLLGLAKSN